MLFGTDGIRGIANQEPITVESTVKLVRAAARVLVPQEKGSRPLALIGRDTRASGEMLEGAAVAGLTSVGIDVLVAGIVPTPAIAYLTATHEADFGIVLSASHNPFQDNGIKFFHADGYKLSDDEEEAIESLYLQDPKHLPTGEKIGRVLRLANGVEQYADFAASTVRKDFSLKGLRIAVDTANGAAFQSTPLVLSRFGADIRLFHAAPDGYNINQSCGSTHGETLTQLVRSTKADLGLAHDGDADRLLLCDEHGIPLDGDEILAIAASALLQKNELRGNTLVATVMSNFGLEQALSRYGGKVLRTNVGDRFVIETLLQKDLNLGGEQSGHIVFRDFTTTGDGLISALQVLSIVRESGHPLSELRKILKKYPQIQRNIKVREKLPFEQFPGIVRSLSEANHALAGRGRVVLRYSGTEPKARLLLEGPEKKTLVKFADLIEMEITEALGLAEQR